MAETTLHDYFVQALAAKNSRERLSLNHIGVQIQQENGNYYVAAVLDGYPAQQAGLERGDMIHRVDGNNYHPVDSFNSLATNTATLHSRFLKQTHERRIDADRDGQNLSVICTPVYENLFDAYRSATEASVQQLPAGNKVIAYVHLWTLSKSTHDLQHFQSVMNRVAQSDGLVLDLRGSQGVLALQHIDAFFPSRSTYTPNVLSKFSKEPQNTSTTRHRYYSNPIAVLQDQLTRGDIELLIQQLTTLDRLVTIGAVTADLQLPPQMKVDYPLTRHSPSDPHFEAALSTLLGNL